MNMENHLCSTYMCFFSVDYSTSFLFFSFILFPSPYLCNYADTYFWDVFSTPPLLHLLVLLCFLPCFFIFSTTLCYHLFLYIHLHVRLPFCFIFPPPNLLPFHSIGTREVVTQKNLSGLVPIRDFRLDPSLLYSIPLLALSPNLLIVWLFLSIAYLVARLRCKWR